MVVVDEFITANIMVSQHVVQRIIMKKISLRLVNQIFQNNLIDHKWTDINYNLNACHYVIKFELISAMHKKEIFNAYS